MKIKLNLFFVLLASLVFYACPNDDDNITVVPEADRTEQQAIDGPLLIEYLENHYYNSDELAGLSNPSMNDIVVTELGDGETVPAGHTLLMDAVVTGNVNYQDADYVYYYLNVNQGGGNSYQFTDDLRLNYSGNTLEELVFDSSASPVVFDLTGTIPGWTIIAPNFNTAGSFELNPDGTVSYEDAGVGMMFLPSGLAYFSASPPGLTSYENLIFRFEIFQSEENDHDLDGVPSYLEDIDGNGFVIDEEDDTDDDNIADFLDQDDDGDGVLTINEDLEPDTDLEVDSDGDGDPTNDIGDGDPTNDDTDGDGIPNYLDTDDDGSKLDDEDGDGIPDYIDND